MKIKIKSFGIIALLFVAIFAATITTSSAAVSIPSTAKTVSTLNIGYTTNWNNGVGGKTLYGNEMQVIYFKPQKAGSWNCKVSGMYYANSFTNPGIVEFAWRSGSGSWNVWRTDNYALNKPVTQVLYSGSADINYRIRMYNPNTYSKYIKTYCSIKV